MQNKPQTTNIGCGLCFQKFKNLRDFRAHLSTCKKDKQYEHGAGQKYSVEVAQDRDREAQHTLCDSLGVDDNPPDTKARHDQI